jgi:hypothetical protein
LTSFDPLVTFDDDSLKPNPDSDMGERGIGHIGGLIWWEDPHVLSLIALSNQRRPKLMAPRGGAPPWRYVSGLLLFLRFADEDIVIARPTSKLTE